MMEKNNMILLNGDDRCEGETTREENNVKSAIDFVLVNISFYDNFMNMIIDEKKIWFDLSDHCLIQTVFEMCHRKSKIVKENKIVEYYTVKEENKESYVYKNDLQLKTL